MKSLGFIFLSYYGASLPSSDPQHRTKSHVAQVVNALAMSQITCSKMRSSARHTAYNSCGKSRFGSQYVSAHLIKLLISLILIIYYYNLIIYCCVLFVRNCRVINDFFVLTIRNKTKLTANIESQDVTYWVVPMLPWTYFRQPISYSRQPISYSKQCFITLLLS